MDGRKTAARTYAILKIIAAALCAVIVAGTAVGVVRGKAVPETAAAPGTAAPPAAAYFTGIGTVRAATAGPKPAAVVVSVAFPYDAADRAFSEELAAKTKRLRETTAGFFAGLDAEALKKIPEAELKERLLSRYNAELRLGRIGTLYFNDYLLLD